MAIVHENLSVNDAVHVIFAAESGDRVAGITANGVHTGFDLFLLCTRLLMGGVRLLYSPELDVDSLTETQLEHLQHKMLRAGVVVNVNSVAVEDLKEDLRGTPMDIGTPFDATHLCSTDGAIVDDHVLLLHTAKNRFVVNFHLFPLV